MPKTRLQDKSKASIVTHQESVSLKFVMHISFAVKGIFSKDLKPKLGDPNKYNV